MAKERKFMDPHEVPPIPGTEGWEEMYPYYYVFGKGNDGADIFKGYREEAATNATLRILYENNWLYEAFENACGFGYLPSLDTAIRISGGDRSCLQERVACVGALRYLFRDDPLRYTTAQAYLWGLQAYLLGQNIEWLRKAKPGLAGGAKKALNAITWKTEDTPAKCWITASLLKAIKIHLQHVLKAAEAVPAGVDDLPDIVEGMQAATARFGLWYCCLLTMPSSRRHAEKRKRNMSGI